VLTEVIHLFLARGLVPAATRPEAHEVLEPRWLPFGEALALASSGRLDDGKSIVGLIWAEQARRAPAVPHAADGIARRISRFWNGAGR
jgi:ADP-ribose pyrophosphatase